jgi:hypothetical protein
VGGGLTEYVVGEGFVFTVRERAGELVATLVERPGGAAGEGGGRVAQREPRPEGRLLLGRDLQNLVAALVIYVARARADERIIVGRVRDRGLIYVDEVPRCI